MKLGVKAPSVLFCLMGTSFPAFPKKKKISTLFLFAFYYFNCFLNFILIVYFIVNVKIEAKSKKVQLCLQINFSILCFCTFSCFVLSLANFYKEKVFWNSLLKVEAAFQIKVVDCKGYNFFLMRCFSKLIILYFGSTWLILFSAYLDVKKEEAASISSNVFFPLFFSNVFVIKFGYYCDVLWFHMQNILNHVGHDKDVKNAKKAIKYFWQLNKQLNHIFELGIAASVVSQYLGIVICLYHLVLKAANEQKLAFGAAYTLFFVAFAIRRMTYSSQRCIDCIKQFSTLSRSLDTKTRMEGFYLQVRHQSLNFFVLRFFNMTNKYVTTVSQQKCNWNHVIHWESISDGLLRNLVFTDCSTISLSLWDTFSFFWQLIKSNRFLNC